MEFDYMHAFVTPVFVSPTLTAAGCYFFQEWFEPRDLHEVARDALAAAAPHRWADFRFGGWDLTAQAGTAEGGQPCIRIGFPEDFAGVAGAVRRPRVPGETRCPCCGTAWDELPGGSV